MATHVHYSSCWAPSKSSYLKLEQFIYDFLSASHSDHMAFIGLPRIFVVTLKSLEVLAIFPHRRKGSLFFLSGLFMLSLVMKIGTCWFDTISLLDFLLVGLHGRRFVFKPFSSCGNLFISRALMLSRAFGKLEKLWSLGFTRMVMGFMMRFLYINRTFGGPHYFPFKVFL